MRKKNCGDEYLISFIQSVHSYYIEQTIFESVRLIVKIDSNNYFLDAFNMLLRAAIAFICIANNESLLMVWGEIAE